MGETIASTVQVCMERSLQKPAMNREWRAVAPCLDADVELLRRMAQGDEGAVQALYAQYGQRMLSFALRLVDDPAVAQDVVQDSLVAAWQQARRYRGEGRAIAWLLGIVRNKALNLRRRRKYPSLDALPEEPREEAALPDELADVGERERLLQNGLRRLSPQHRMVLELVFYQGLDLAETAAVCGCPVGTVKSRLNHARAALRGALNRDGIRQEDLL